MAEMGRLAFRAFCALMLVMGSRAVGAAELRLQVEASSRVNAVYHVACLGDSIACTKNVFERFWKERLDWTSVDQTHLDAWRQVMKDVTDGAPPRPPAPLLPNAPRFHPGQAARETVLVAAVESRSSGDLVRRSKGSLSAENAARLKTAIDHFERRIRPWLKSAGEKAFEGRTQQVEQIARRNRMLETAAQVAAFLEAELPGPNVYVHIIVAPDPTSKDFTATAFANHFVVEVVEAVTADGIVSGALHELTHYLYDRAPLDKHLRLLEEFVRSAAPSFAGLYTYLNEAIAVAAQGLYADRLGERGSEEEGYDHPYVAPLGAATTPLLKDAVARRGTLFSGFAARYLSAGAMALQKKLSQPQFVLAQVAFLLPDDSDRMTAAYYGMMFPKASAQFRSAKDLEAFPDVSVVQFVRYDALGALGEIIPDLASFRSHRGFAYAMSRGRGARTYVLAGRDTDAIIEVVTKLGGLETLTSTGLLFSVD
jgi:hypothetical protein